MQPKTVSDKDSYADAPDSFSRRERLEAGRARRAAKLAAGQPGAPRQVSFDVTKEVIVGTVQLGIDGDTSPLDAAFAHVSDDVQRNDNGKEEMDVFYRFNIGGRFHSVTVNIR